MYKHIVYCISGNTNGIEHIQSAISIRSIVILLNGDMIIWAISLIKPHRCLKPLRLTPKHGKVIVSKGFNNNDIGTSIDANGQKCFNTDR